MNKRQLEYYNLLIDDIEDNVRWIQIETNDNDIIAEHQIELLEQYAKDLQDAINSLKSLVLYGDIKLNV